MCCLINEMVTCVDNIGCGAMMTDVLTPLKGQLSSICGDYSYTEGCSYRSSKILQLSEEGKK